MNFTTRIILTLVGLGLCGCATKMGPQAVKPDRFNYNQSIVISGNAELLLNIVRLRYRDRPLFMELQSVVTSRSLSGKISAGATIGIDGTSQTEFPLGASVGYDERPTITYKPLQGKDFATRVLSPLTPQTILLLSNSGWSIERLFLMCVSRLNGIENAQSAAGPTPEIAPEFREFQELVGLLRTMQQNDVLKFQVLQNEVNHDLEIETVVDLPPEFSPASNPEIEMVRQKLGIIETKQRLALTTALEPLSKRELALSPRSLMSVFYFLSQAVEPPPEHEEAGLVTLTRDEQGNRFDWSLVTGKLMRIRSQKTKPENGFAAVLYRGYWFFIDESDLNSKSTLSLLHFLLSLQSATGADQAPILSLPAI